MTHFSNYPTELDVLTARDISAAFVTDRLLFLAFIYIYFSYINLYIRLCFKELEIMRFNCNSNLSDLKCKTSTLER